MAEANEDESLELESIVAALRRDYSKFSTRLRELKHTVVCECEGVVLRLHFPAFRQGKATVHEFIDQLSLYMTAYALPRAEVAVVDQKYGKISAEDFRNQTTELNQRAVRTFKKASELTGRNGECGELILYLLTEWILAAPQLIAKMSLKTNPEMPVHGSDGVHVRYSKELARLYLYWGESKLYADVGSAISEAVKSIATAMSFDKMQHEIDLVKRNIDLSGLDPSIKQELLLFLDPMEENYNKRFDVITSLIGFDFQAYAEISPADGDQGEAKFSTLVQQELVKLSPLIAAKLKEANLDKSIVEMFLLPVPSVQQLRDLFQAKIGWKTA